MRLGPALLLSLALAGLPASAQQAAPSQFPKHAEYAERLDQLFGDLHKATSTAEAEAAETKIRAIWSHDNDDEAVTRLAEASLAMQLGDLDRAEPILDALVDAHPEFAEAWNRRATLYFMQGRYPASLADIAKVLALEPRHFGALSGKGAILRAQGRNAEALSAMKESLALDPFVPGLKAAVEELEKANPEL